MRTGGMAMDETVMLAIKEGIPNPIEIEDYSHYTMLARFMAGGMGIPYMPVRSSLGTDIPKYNNRIKIVNDPFENKPVLLAPAARTDVCFISAHRADRRGNAQIFGAQWPDDAMCRACEHLVVITEELVPPEVIQKYPTNTLMPCYSVDAVVELPFNCHPLACYGCYAQDTPCFLGLALSFRTRDGVLKWLDEWVYGTKDHFEYCDKVGWRNLMRLAKMEKSINRIPE
jgi:glutaconate CoA-transferase subunit A